MGAFSKRSTFEQRPNAWAARVAEARAQDRALLDLTESNPTRCGLHSPPTETAPQTETAPMYEAAPLGIRTAREAVARYYSDLGITVSPDQIVLTASTSEAYSLLFKLLLNPNDAVLIPRPSYPLFDFLAQLDAVESVSYRAMDGASLEGGLSTGARLALVVNPNNPTGDYVSPDFRHDLLDALSGRNGALIADEVFYDYGHNNERPESFAGSTEVLCFTLSGLSKVCGLPGHKCSWMVVSGPPELQSEALSRLECMGDTYLSVSAGVQNALPSLLRNRHAFQEAVRDRTRRNLDYLRRRIDGVEPPQGGWSAVIRLAPGQDDEAMAIQVLEQQNVVVHPGYLFDYASHDRWVLSLLPQPDRFSEAVDRLALAL